MEATDPTPDASAWPSPPPPPPPLGAAAVPSPSASPSEPQAVFQMGQLTVSSDGVPPATATATAMASNFVSVNRGARPPTPVVGAAAATDRPTDGPTDGPKGASSESGEVGSSAPAPASTDAPAAAAESSTPPGTGTGTTIAKPMQRKRAKWKRLAAESSARAAADGSLSGPDTSDGGAPLVAAPAAAPAKGKAKYSAAQRAAKRAEWRNTEAQRKQQQKLQKQQKQLKQQQNKEQNQAPAAKAKASKKKKQQQAQSAPPAAPGEAPPAGPAAAADGPVTEGADDAGPAVARLARVDGLPPAPPSSRARSPVRAPSAASGGVPEPTAAYLAAAALEPAARPPAAPPQPLLVVIDLNGTLLYRPSRHKQPRRFVPRPHAAAFLRHCLREFAVVVWSSARPENVDAMWRELLATGGGGGSGHNNKAPHDDDDAALPPPPPPVAVWGRDRFGLSHADYNQRVQCYKRLSTVWGNPAVAASFPGPAGDAAAAAAADTAGVAPPPPHGWSQANTVLIDDSLEKARSEPHNLIAIPEYAGGSEQPPVLPLVRDYLHTLRFQQNVSAYMRAHPFRVPAKGPGE